MPSLVERVSSVLASSADRWRARPRGLRPAQPNPAGNRQYFYSGTGSTALRFVSDEQVLGLPAAGRAVRMIANAVASMAPPKLLAPDGVTELPAPPVVLRPNATYGLTEWWRMVVAHYITSGNFVGLFADPEPFTGWPRQIVPINSKLVRCYFDEAGFVRYDIGDLTGLTQDDLVHVRAFTVPGNPWGIGVVDAYARNLGLAFDQRDMASSLYQSGGVPSGVLKPGLTDFDRTQAEALQTSWVDRFSGGARKPAVIPEDWNFEPLAWSPEAMEFLTSRAFTVAEIALMFDMDPSDLGSSFGGGSSQLTYANITQRETARVVSSYGPHVATFEDAWSDLVPGGNLVRFRRGNLLHASRADLFAEQAVGIGAGILTKDEARAELNMPPLPEPDPPPPPPLEVPSTTGTPEPAPLELTPGGDG